MDRTDLAVFMPSKDPNKIKKQINIRTARNYTVKRTTIQ